jgi:hypothetical protein
VADEDLTPAAPKVSDEESSRDLQTVLQNFEDAYDQSWNERSLAQQCRDYYDGSQWTQEELDTLRARKQPPITSNKIFPKINSLVGYEKMRRTDPKAYPRTPKHDKDAEAATDALRYIAERNSFDEIRSSVAEYVMVEGAAAATVTAKKCHDGSVDVAISIVDWDRFYRDPHSRRRDFSDAKFMGVVIWMDEDDALHKYGGSEDIEAIIKGAYSNTSPSGASDTYDDRPKLTWGDTNRKRIRVLQHRWIKDGKWHTAIACRGGFLRAPQVSPYLDDEGYPACDLHAVSAFVTRENQRQGIVRHMLSPQDMVNKHLSKATHRLAVNQIVAEHGAVESVSKAKQEAAKPDGFIEVNPNMRFEFRDKFPEMAGEMQLLQAAALDIDQAGPSPALAGRTAAPSGRAQEVQQGSELTEQSVIFDALKHWSWRVYKAAWCCVRQYWTAEKWIRVTDDESNIRFVGLNRPVTVMEEIQQMQEQGQPIPPKLQMMAMVNPQAVVRVENPVGELDVDIIVEDGPDTVTVQAEQFTQLVELSKNAPPGTIPIEMVIEASNLRNKERILEHLKEGAVPPQVQQQMQAMQKAIEELSQKLQATEADKSVDMFNAQTKRLEAVTDAEAKLRPEISGQVVMTPDMGVMQ